MHVRAFTSSYLMFVPDHDHEHAGSRWISLGSGRCIRTTILALPRVPNSGYMLAYECCSRGRYYYAYFVSFSALSNPHHFIYKALECYFSWAILYYEFIFRVHVTLEEPSHRLYRNRYTSWPDYSMYFFFFSFIYYSPLIYFNSDDSGTSDGSSSHVSFTWRRREWLLPCALW